MGRIKQVAIKTLGNEIIEVHGKKFSEDFDKNKEVLATIKDIKSKKIRNVLAGYITKEIQRINKSGL
ncbi:MAG: 30S ribosomal protein S17e [Candidatus Aenigmarchaeota archaeon]|nr:30S ribosomal protein S17e [Candidatus Aenigmarchaeota archaeon]